ncbi:MAG: bifunctional diaminohydroxyphosphoribosylaminopyrimidine deaminase/5-amino-6-(5-phosphoribosylamino)uracil reductase RibD [Deltaproteobacteria bacterium]|nr:bifunctional diaminohydroxyphosphoribosylaminopyrimidine deaminase/5-amino-6-(5-phosphoribosylamino)uracil reductase RibD [Deltaproteobacteria bacterium]
MGSHEDFMRLAVNVAKKGIGRTSPNPAVGAVVVKDNRIVGKGYHKMAGLAHAEINALNDAGNRAKGADLYVTLEPCSHYGKTPPCTLAVIERGIKRVFIGMKDPNPLVNGRGIRKLKGCGIEVKAGIFEDECRNINKPYMKYIKTGMPFVTLKLAASLDGRIATSAGESKWITADIARRYVHKIRSNADAVMVGIGTVLNDDPLLTVRVAGKREVRNNPIRIVVDSRLKTPLKARLLNVKEAKTIIATTKYADKKKIIQIEGKGAEVIVVDLKDRFIDLKKLMLKLGRLEIMNILIEGGSKLAASALKQGIIDNIKIFYAPILLGGDGIPLTASLGIKRLKDAVHFKDVRIKRIGEDMLIEGVPVYNSVSDQSFMRDECKS